VRLPHCFNGFLGLFKTKYQRVYRLFHPVSSLGLYRQVALGVSAYSAAIFHLFTHRHFLKFFLYCFLAAGFVILALHHQQDIRQMGGLKKIILPITYWTSLIGTLALIGFSWSGGPFFFAKVHQCNGGT